MEHKWQLWIMLCCAMGSEYMFTESLSSRNTGGRSYLSKHSSAIARRSKYSQGWYSAFSLVELFMVVRHETFARKEFGRRSSNVEGEQAIINEVNSVSRRK